LSNGKSVHTRRPSLQMSAALLLLAAFSARASCAPRTVELVLPAKAHPAVEFGAAELRQALGRRGVQITTARRAASLRIILAERQDPSLKDMPDPRVPDEPESYAIAVSESGTVFIEGSDASGLMYGAMDLAEQIAWASQDDFVAQIEPRRKSPFLPVRGINMLLTAQGFDQPDSWYWDDAFWESFLNMMARTRHNFLDLHGPFDVTVSWPNGFSYFVFLPEFAEVGVGEERAAKNLVRFRQIIHMAARRGIKVGFMNYSAAATVGPWNTGTFWGNTQPFTGCPQTYLTGPRLEAYTRSAVAAFLKAVPELWIFGFRIGESGQPEDFYRKTYLPAIKEVPSSLNLYVRTWVADPKKVRELAAECPNHFFIEPKFNGEHLGLPYQAALGGRFYPPSGSYEDYTNYPRTVTIIWQVRASGTHRVFHWGWPDFARRTVESCKFGGGVGFSMEPMNTYSPQTDYVHNNPDTDHKTYRWVHQQQWLWYLIWGRTAYDPAVSERVWLEQFNERFGRDAGPLTYRAIVESSKVVPLVYAFHNQGLDHTAMAPEFETGDHAAGARNTLWQGSYRVSYGGDAGDFATVDTLDPAALADPSSYAENRLKARPTGRVSPFEVAAYLSKAADTSRALIAQAVARGPKGAKEFDCIRMDIEAVAALARYYANRISSATHLELYKLTYHHPELTTAREFLEAAIRDWDRLADVTDKHFSYVPELIRMRTYKFRWRDEGRSLGADLEFINRKEAEFFNLSWGAFRWRTQIGHVPPEDARPGHPLKISATLSGASDDMRVFLLYQRPGDAAYVEIPMAPESTVERTWSAEIPAAAMAPGTLRYYFEAHGGVGVGYGGTLDLREPYTVRVSETPGRLEIEHVPPSGSIRTNKVDLTARVRGDAVESVRVYYRSMPAYHGWLSLEMASRGNGEFGASVPLSPEGILYYFEAIGGGGAAVHYPDFRNATPYFVIDAWDARTGSGAAR